MLDFRELPLIQLTHLCEGFVARFAFLCVFAMPFALRVVNFGAGFLQRFHFRRSLAVATIKRVQAIHLGLGPPTQLIVVLAELIQLLNLRQDVFIAAVTVSFGLYGFAFIVPRWDLYQKPNHVNYTTT